MTDAMTPTLKPMPLSAEKNNVRERTGGCDVECLRRTILLVNPPLMPRTRCKHDENM